jgi:hypothetical protein
MMVSYQVYILSEIDFFWRAYMLKKDIFIKDLLIALMTDDSKRPSSSRSTRERIEVWVADTTISRKI